MSEILTSVVTSCLTIIGGVIIYVTGQVITKFFIDPIHEQKKLLAEVVDALIFHGNMFGIYTQRDPKADEITDKIRGLSTRLRSRTMQIPWYGRFARLGWVISREDVDCICTNLIGLANSFYKTGDYSWEHVNQRRDAIGRVLKVSL